MYLYTYIHYTPQQLNNQKIKDYTFNRPNIPFHLLNYGCIWSKRNTCYFKMIDTRKFNQTLPSDRMMRCTALSVYHKLHLQHFSFILNIYNIPHIKKRMNKSQVGIELNDGDVLWSKYFSPPYNDGEFRMDALRRSHNKIIIAVTEDCSKVSTTDMTIFFLIIIITDSRRRSPPNLNNAPYCDIYNNTYHQWDACWIIFLLTLNLCQLSIEGT